MGLEGNTLKLIRSREGMSTGHIQAYKHDNAWVIIRNLQWLAAERHSFDSWTGADWSEQVGRSKRFGSQNEADTYIVKNHERLLGARMA